MEPAPKRALFLIFVTVFIDLLGFGIVLPLLPRYGEHFAADGFLLGGLTASFSAMQFLFAPLWGRLSDRIGRKPVLLVGLAGSTVFYGFFALVTMWGNSGPILGLSPLVWLFITRIGAGISGATIATAQAYIADVTPPTERSRGMALIGAAFGIGFTFGPLLGSLFVSNVHGGPPSSAPGWLASFLSGLAFLAAVAFLPESLKASERTVAGEAVPRAKLSDLAGVVRLLLASIFLTTFAFAQFETTISRLTNRLGLSDQQNFWVFASIGLTLTLAQGFLVRRFLPLTGPFRMAIGGIVMMTIGLGLIGWASSLASIWGVIGAVQVCVVGYAATTPSLNGLLSLKTASNQQGAVLGIGQSMAALARIAGPLAGLPLQDLGISTPYWVAAAVMMLGVPLMWPVGKHSARSADE